MHFDLIISTCRVGDVSRRFSDDGTTKALAVYQTFCISKRMFHDDSRGPGPIIYEGTSAIIACVVGFVDLAQGIYTLSSTRTAKYGVRRTLEQ